MPGPGARSVLCRNYLKVMPLTTTAAAFLSGSQYTVRNTLVGERATPGKYAAHLADQAIRAEVTTAPGVALHRCVAFCACLFRRQLGSRVGSATHPVNQKGR